MKSFLKTVFILVILAAIGVGAWWGFARYSAKDAPITLKKEAVRKTTITRSIGATGTVEPEELVNVGAQVQGMIASFGVDCDKNEVNYTSRVKAGMVLAKIDDSLYHANMKSAAASQQQAIASITSAKASLQQAEARLELATFNWERAQKLAPVKAIAKADYDNVKAEYHIAAANLAAAKAAIGVAEAQKASADASFVYAKRNLDYCTIKSPVDGVIIDRRVSVGQTVVSSMTAPSLFLIAKDLKKMEVWVSVNEADIGSIKLGQDVEFTVDAFADRTFYGKVQKIRLNATMSQNVVTYVVEVGTDNSDGTLLPYLTANVKFILSKASNVLAVPNAALRFTPPQHGMIPERKKGERIVWVDAPGLPQARIIKTGLTDGFLTQVLSGDLKEGETVLTGIEIKVPGKPGIRNASGGSPFMPKPPQRRRRNPNQGKNTPAQGGGR